MINQAELFNGPEFVNINSIDIEPIDADELNCGIYGTIYLYHEFAPSLTREVKVGSSIMNNPQKSEKSIATQLKVIIHNDKSILNNTSGIKLPDINVTNCTISHEYQLFAFNFIVDYLNTYVNTNEPSEMHPPFSSEKLATWLNDENDYKIFAKYMNINDSDDANKLAKNKKLLLELMAIASLANHLEMTTLMKKAASLIAHAIHNKPEHVIKAHFSYFTNELSEQPI